jgi:hypothetical protein
MFALQYHTWKSKSVQDIIPIDNLNILTYWGFIDVLKLQDLPVFYTTFIKFFEWNLFQN